MFDALENLQLLSITNALGADYAEALARLQIFTWLKWFGVAAVYASRIPGMRSRGAAGRIGALFAALTVFATIGAFVLRGVAAELMSLFGDATVAAVTLAFRADRAKPPLQTTSPGAASHR